MQFWSHLHNYCNYPIICIIYNFFLLLLGTYTYIFLPYTSKNLVDVSMDFFAFCLKRRAFGLPCIFKRQYNGHYLRCLYEWDYTNDSYHNNLCILRKLLLPRVSHARARHKTPLYHIMNSKMESIFDLTYRGCFIGNM